MKISQYIKQITDSVKNKGILDASKIETEKNNHQIFMTDWLPSEIEIVFGKETFYINPIFTVTEKYGYTEKEKYLYYYSCQVASIPAELMNKLIDQQRAKKAKITWRAGANIKRTYTREYYFPDVVFQTFHYNYEDSAEGTLVISKRCE